MCTVGRRQLPEKRSMSLRSQECLYKTGISKAGSKHCYQSAAKDFLFPAEVIVLIPDALTYAGQSEDAKEGRMLDTTT